MRRSNDLDKKVVGICIEKLPAGGAGAEGEKMSTEKLQSLLADILSEPPLISTHKEPAPTTFFDQEPDEAKQERDEVTTRADQNLAADIGLTHEDIHEAPKIDDAEKESPDIVRQTPAEQTSADAPAAAENLAIRAEQAKSLLTGLDLDTAIRLRWAMRDIRGKRTKMSPVSENDLAALIDLGLVEIREGIPRLTGLGVLALD
jgi:hypothetical protein